MGISSEKIAHLNALKEKRLDRRYARRGLMFSTMIVFVSIAMPLLLKVDISGVRFVLVIASLVSALFCLATLAVLLYADERELREVENKLIKARGPFICVNACSTLLERFCTTMWIPSFLAALACMFVAVIV